MARIGVVLAIALAIAVAACGGASSSEPLPQGGIAGTVVAGPVCPVERPGDPACAPRPVPGALLTIRDPAGNEVATVTSGADGRYEIRLQPGRYTIEGSPVEGLMGNPAPLDVDVGQAVVVVDLAYDTGIR